MEEEYPISPYDKRKLIQIKTVAIDKNAIESFTNDPIPQVTNFNHKFMTNREPE